MIYWIVLFVVETLLLLSYQKVAKLPALRKGILLLIILSLTYFSGFRDGIGMDYTAYKELCEHVVYQPDVSNFGLWILSEPLVSSLQTFCYETNLSAVLFFVTSSAIICGLCLWVYSQFEYFVWSAFIFIFFTGLYLYSMNITRQFVAAAILLLGYFPLLRENSKKNILIYIGTVFIAVLIHHSALFMILPLFFGRKNFNNLFIVIILIASFVLPINLISKMPSVLEVLDVLDYTSYMDYSSSGISKFSLSNIYLHLLLVPFLLKKKKILNREDSTSTILLIKLYVIYLVLMNLSSGELTITYRLAVYFSVFIPLLLVKLLDLMNKAQAKAIIVIPILILMGVRLATGDRLTVPNRILPLNSIYDSNYYPYNNPTL